MRRNHFVWIRYGTIPPKIKLCPLFGCVVAGDGLTSCSHLACPSCGVGPPWIDLDRVAHCDMCGARWKLA